VAAKRTAAGAGPRGRTTERDAEGAVNGSPGFRRSSARFSVPRGLRGGSLLSGVTLALFLLFLDFPFVWMLVTSLKPDADLYNPQQSPLALPRVTGEHYAKLMEQLPFGEWVGNTLLVAATSTAISLVIGTLAAYALARLRFRGAPAVGMGIFITYLVPTSLLFLPLAHVVRQLGLYDSLGALIVTYPTFLVPFSTWLLMGYFRTIPRELEECATVDGATRMQAFRLIILPVALPGLVSAGIFAFTLSWNEYLYALSFINTDALRTVSVGVPSKAIVGGDAYQWGQLMAAAVLGSVPIALGYSFFLRYYVAGMTAGAVKG
jgi:multiple sugar transport system permease protein